MYDHIGLRVGNLDASVRFYTAALAPLGFGCARAMIPAQALGRRARRRSGCICTRAGEVTGAHVAFRAQYHDEVKKFHGEA